MQPITFENDVQQSYDDCNSLAKSTSIDSITQFVSNDYCLLTASSFTLFQFWSDGNGESDFEIVHLNLCIFILYHFLQN